MSREGLRELFPVELMNEFYIRVDKLLYGDHRIFCYVTVFKQKL